MYLALFGTILYLLLEVTIKRWRLAKSGTVTKAFVYDSKKVGRKGTINYYFSYKVGQNIMRGDNASRSFIVGDSVFIMYDQSDPEKFWPLSRLEDDFASQLKSNPSYQDFKRKRL